jgi:hypothetical protein
MIVGFIQGTEAGNGCAPYVLANQALLFLDSLWNGRALGAVATENMHTSSFVLVRFILLINRFNR